MKIKIEKIGDYGWLPVMEDPDGYETYRGEYQQTSLDAYNKCIWWIENKLDVDGYLLEVD